MLAPGDLIPSKYDPIRHGPVTIPPPWRGHIDRPLDGLNIIHLTDHDRARRGIRGVAQELEVAVLGDGEGAVGVDCRDVGLHVEIGSDTMLVDYRVSKRDIGKLCYSQCPTNTSVGPSFLKRLGRSVCAKGFERAAADTAEAASSVAMIVLSILVNVKVVVRMNKRYRRESEVEGESGADLKELWRTLEFSGGLGREGKVGQSGEGGSEDQTAPVERHASPSRASRPE